jgi:hypothetical protein
VSRFVTCYPADLSKRKALEVCGAFADGVREAGGDAKVCATIPAALEAGVAVFYGVRPQIAHLWEQAKRERRDWVYIDNSYFDCVREMQFRVTLNAIQHTGLGTSDGKRFAELGIKVKPMRSDGDDVVFCPQSNEFMLTVAQDPHWAERVLANLRATYGIHRVAVRYKHTQRSLLEDLGRAGLLVTWSSAAAVTALLEGVKVMCAPQCCATFASDRQRWAEVLADNQWTLSEISRGDAWRKLATAGSE